MDYTRMTKTEMLGELRTARRRIARLEQTQRSWRKREKALRESEDLTRLISENAEDLIAVLDVNGKRLYNSPSYRNVLGDPKSLAGTDSFNEIHPDDREYVKKIFEETVHSGVGQRAEYRFLLRDGSIRYIESQGSVIRDDSGETSRVVVVARDITSRKEADRVIRLLAQTVSSTRDCVSITDLEDNVLFVNDAFLHTYGYSEEELMAHGLALVSLGSGHGELDQEIRRSTLAGGWNGEVIHRRKDGSEFPVELWTSVVRNESGDPVALVGVGRDTTERRRAEKVQAATYRISEAAHSGGTLEEVLSSIHTIIGDIIPARNFYIALYDATSDLVTFPYFVDEFDQRPAPKTPGKGLTEYVLRTGKPLLATPAVFEDLVMQGEVEAIGAPSIDWLGIPLRVKDSTIGVLVVQSYSDGVRFSEEDAKILMFVSSQVAMSIERALALEELRKSEAQFRAVFEAAGIGMVLSDLSGRIIQSNRSMQEMLGYTGQELRQRKLSDVTHQEDAQKEAVRDPGSFRERTLTDRYSAQKRYIRKDGRVVWGRFTGSLIWDADANPLYWIGMVEDITERKRAEERLATLNEAMLSFGPDPDENINRLVALCGEQLGATSAIYNRLEDGKLHSVGQWHTPPDYKSVDVAEGHICHDVIRLGRSEASVIRNLQETTYATTDVNVKRYGLKTYIGRPVAFDNQFVGSLCVLYKADVTPNSEDLKLLGIAASAIAVEEKRKRAEEQLYNSRQMLRLVLDTIPQRVFWKDRSLTYVGCNRPFALDAGLDDPAVVVGKNDLNMPWRELAPIYHADDIDVMESNTPKINYEEPLTRPDGSSLWLKTSKVPMVDRDGNVFGVLGTYEDITERKKAQESLRESEERYRRLVELTPDAIYVHSDGEFIFTNNAGIQMLGAAGADEIVGKKIVDFVHPEFRKQVRDRVARMVEDGEAVPTVEEKFVKLDGTPFDVEVAAIPFVYQGRTAVQVVARDISARKRAEESERKLLHAVEQTDEVIFMTDRDGAITYANPAFEKVYGYSRKETIGSTPRMIKSGALTNDFYAGFWQTLLSGKGFRDEIVNRTKDGRMIRIQASVNPVFNAAGDIVGFIAVQEDITERKRAEEELLMEKTRFQQLFENIPLGVAMLDRGDVILQVNKAFGRVFQYTAEEVHGRMINDLIVPEEFKLEGDQLSSMTQQGKQIEIETVRTRKDGEPLQVHIYGVPVVSNGQSSGIYGIYEDISERKIAEGKIREQAALLDIARDAILVRDLEGTILFWNKGAEDLYGWAEADILGRNWTRLFKEDDAAKSVAATKMALEKGEWAGEMRNIGKGGKEIIVQSRWSVVKDDNNEPESILVVSTDITDKKELERKFHHAQRLETMGTLAGGIAHDLNNVLAPIMMAIELLKPKFPDEKAQRLLTTMESSARRGADIVKQVLTFARGVEGERIVLQPKHLLREMEKFAEETFPKSIQLRTSVPKDLWTVQGDATQLHQVLLNLCVNARDAMPQGGVLELKGENVILDEQGAHIHLKARPGPYVVFSVSDTGIGIPEENLERIFDPFFTTKEVGKGTGLGLSTVLGIVDGHKGFITVSSQWGNGSLFKIYVPAEVGAAAGTTKEAPADLPVGNGELILVIDDESSIREITRDILESYGYHVLTAKDGMDAALVYEKHNKQIDAVVTDMMMPNMDGAAIIRIMKRVNPEVKIIAASGLSEDEQVNKGIKDVVQAFLPKPYKADVLLKTLKAILA